MYKNISRFHLLASIAPGLAANTEGGRSVPEKMEKLDLGQRDGGDDCVVRTARLVLAIRRGGLLLGDRPTERPEPPLNSWIRTVRRLFSALALRR